MKRRTKIDDRSTVYRGHFQVARYVVRHALFAGGMSQPLSREVFERGNAAVVLPYDPRRDEVVLIEQFRMGAYAAGIDAWTVEAVAGIVEPGETAEAVARREAVEEAGLTLGRLVPIGRTIISPGGSSEVVDLFCGEADATTANGIHGLAEEGEDIRAFVEPADAAIARLGAGNVLNGPTMITLQWLALNRAALRTRWRR